MVSTVAEAQGQRQSPFVAGAKTVRRRGAFRTTIITPRGAVVTLRVLRLVVPGEGSRHDPCIAGRVVEVLVVLGRKCLKVETPANEVEEVLESAEVAAYIQPGA